MGLIKGVIEDLKDCGIEEDRVIPF